MKNKYKDTSSDWLYFAKTDLKVAKLVLKEKIYNMVCFHSQQAVEKSMKAFLRHKGK
ncbi:HEPN domain-containing protein, partial [Patescibacteria group bacterium]|nr:HEPN domain-containing protein [Patescibacteria group bacterium]